MQNWSRIRTVLLVILGTLIGSTVNGAILDLSAKFFPLPKGADNSSMEALQKTIHLFRPIDYFPAFLAHAMGSLVAAICITLFIKDQKAHRRGSYIASGLFLIGGIIMVMALPAPFWFESIDLVFAYFPMAFLGIFIAEKLRKA